MYDRLVIPMKDKEIEALKQAALLDMRDYRMQARLIIKTNLERRGLLNKNSNLAESTKADREPPPEIRGGKHG